MILRPGGVTWEDLTQLLGKVEIHQSALAALENAEAAPSPGMKHKHYAPTAKVTVGRGQGAAEAMISAYDEKKAEGVHPWLLVSQGSSALCGGRHALCYGDGGADLAANLFHSLRILDSKGATHIYCEAVDTEGIGLAAMNRLLRAAEFDIIDL